MIPRRLFALLATSVLLAACHSSEDAGMPAEMMESDAGEAAVRHIIQSLPALNPGVPKNYCIVLGEISLDGMMTPATEPFVKRFADLKLEFVNALDLKAIQPDMIIVDNKNRLATYVLQLRRLRQLSTTTWEAETGWSYKHDFGREKLVLAVKDGKVTVTSAQKVE